jgi:hypothetical protein
VCVCVCVCVYVCVCVVAVVLVTAAVYKVVVVAVEVKVVAVATCHRRACVLGMCPRASTRCTLRSGLGSERGTASSYKRAICAMQSQLAFTHPKFVARFEHSRVDAILFFCRFGHCPTRATTTTTTTTTAASSCALSCRCGTRSRATLVCKDYSFSRVRPRWVGGRTLASSRRC